MDELKQRIFITGDKLLTAIESQTTKESVKFQRRDFVAPLVKFCMNNDYSAKVGIIYGLRSTGKTVGMLQAADELLSAGHKAAYVRFNYRQSGIGDVNNEIQRLAGEGFTHFFIDEAPYLNGFLTDSAEWADTLTPVNRIKIIISGTDSFELWLAMNRSLYHRYVRFSANRNSYPEFKRVLGQSYDEYKSAGGIFLPIGETNPDELWPSPETQGESAVENFIQAAVVENLVHTLEHCNEGQGSKNYYYDWLYAIDKLVIFKGVISILESTAAAPVRKNFIQDADKKNIPSLGTAVSKWPDPEKREIKERIAESLSVYQEFKKIDEPGGTIDALVEFLIKIGCLAESYTGVSDLVERKRTLYFTHNALMNYAVQETVQGVLTLTGIDSNEFVDALKQAAEGSINENVVYAHLLFSIRGNERLFRYRDPDDREIDAVIIDREKKTLKLIEVKSKAQLNDSNVFKGEAKNLFNAAVLKNIGVDDSFAIKRVVVYRGETRVVNSHAGALILANIEDLLVNYANLENYLDSIGANPNERPKAFAEQLRKDAARLKRDYVPQKNNAGRKKRCSIDD